MSGQLFRQSVLCAGLVAASAPVFAINGSQPVGYGAKNSAMGGASIALPLDAEAAANNPAGIALIPQSFTLGTLIFDGKSSTDYFIPGNHLENHTTIAMPTGGISYPLNDRVTLGLSLAAQGVGADYKRPLLPVPGAGNAKTSLKVAELIPTVAWKATPDLALGASLNLVYQQFEASGVVVPAPVPGGLAAVPDHGTANAHGVGLRLGALWKVDPQLALGVNYKTRTRMSKLDGYADDLLAFSEGRLDVPSQYGVGVAWTPNEKFTLAADWLRIQYGSIRAMQDPMGFGWKDQPVLRLGASWAMNESLTLRAGYSRNKRQIDDSRLAQNVLVPSLFDRAYTAGFSWHTGAHSDINVGLEVNPERKAVGTGPSTGTTLNAQARMLSIGYEHRF